MAYNHTPCTLRGRHSYPKELGEAIATTFQVCAQWALVRYSWFRAKSSLGPRKCIRLASLGYSLCNTANNPMMPSITVFNHGCSDSMIVT